MARRARRRNRSISPERRTLYQIGLLLQIAAGIGILVCFIGFVTAGKAAVDSMGRQGNPVSWWIGIPICIGLGVVGGIMRSVGARGVAGSGLVLDPERARDDLEPWARTGGGLLGDVLDEAGIDRDGARESPPPPPHVVKVRCPSCGALNDEDARFCDQCGSAL